MCWVFDVLPSTVERFIWEITYEDVQTRTKLKIGEKLAYSNETQSVAMSIVETVLTGMFGTGNKSGAAEAPQTREEAIQMKNQFMGIF